jgi:hypothetical protein
MPPSRIRAPRVDSLAGRSTQRKPKAGLHEALAAAVLGLWLSLAEHWPQHCSRASGCERVQPARGAWRSHAMAAPICLSRLFKSSENSALRRHRQ